MVAKINQLYTGVNRLAYRNNEKMKASKNLTRNSTVKECLERFPQTVCVFMDAGFLCVGCPTEAFHTLEDVAREYQLDLNQLLKQIRQAIEVAK